MDDDKIIELFILRNEDALLEAEAKYGKLCKYIAHNILGNKADSEECASDAMLKAWNTIPPSMPKSLKAYLCTLARHAALDKYRFNSAEKRGGSSEEIYGELSLITLKDDNNPEDDLIFKELMNSFLTSLKKQARIIFLQRYYYFCSVKEISELLSVSESTVKVTLLRTREKLKAKLEREGISL